MAEGRQTFLTRILSRRRRFWLATMAAVVVIGVALGNWAPSAGLRWGVVKALRSAGMDQVMLGGADLSLFDGALTVRGINAGQDGGSAFDLGGLLLDFRWKPLASKRVSVEALELNDADVELRRDGATWHLNGLPLGVGPDESGSQWSFDVDRLVLRDSRLTVIDGATKVLVQLDELRVENLRSWDQGAAMAYHLAGRINGAPIQLAGSALPFAATPGFDMRASAENLDLAPFAKLAGLDRLAGRLSAQLNLAGQIGAPIDMRGTLTMAQAAVETGGTRITADSLGWDGAATISAGLHGAGTLVARQLTIAAGTTTITAASADLVAAKAEWAAGKAALAGTLSTQGLAIAAAGTNVKAASADLAADKVEWAAGKGAFAGTLKAATIEVASADMAVNAATLGWKGNAGFTAQGDVRSDAALETEKLVVRTGGRVIEHARAAATGTLATAAATGILPPLAGTLNAWAENVAVHEPTRELAVVERVEATALALNGEVATIQRLEMRGLKALARPGRSDWRVESRRIAVDRAAMNAAGDVVIAGLGLTGPLARLTRTADGFTGFTTAEATGGDGAMPQMRVGRLRVRDGKVEFDDRTTSEPVRLNITAIDVTAHELDSATPDHDSPFSLKARIGASALAANGSVRPFAPSFSGTMKGDIKSLELPPLSPYAADNLGVHLHTGHFDGDLSLAVDGGALNGRMDMVLSNLFVAQPDPNARIAKQADMPVETVLDLLRDSEDRIRLTIPVRGDLANPDFDVSDAVSQAVGGALKSTLVTTLKVAFPVAALIGYVIDGSSSTRLSLEPLDFAAGLSDLSDPHRAKLATVADLMRQRPGVALTLCGIASQPEDWPALLEARRIEELGLLAKLQKLMGNAPKADDVPADRDALTALADKRAQSVKAWLVDKGGIDAGRLFTCRPQVDADGKGAPRVDLLL